MVLILTRAISLCHHTEDGRTLVRMGQEGEIITQDQNPGSNSWAILSYNSLSRELNSTRIILHPVWAVLPWAT